MRDKSQLLLPSKSCRRAFKIVRVWNSSQKGDCSFFFFSPSLSLILHSHISSCCKNEISPSNFIVAIVIMDRSEGSTGKLLLSGHLWDLPLCPVTEKFVKIAQCLLTINIQRLLCAVIKFHPCC